MFELSWVREGVRISLYVFGLYKSLPLVLRCGGFLSYLEVAKLFGSVPDGHLPTYQDIPLCHGLVNNLQDMLNLGAVILLCVVSLFLLPYSNLLPAMQRCGVRAKEEIEGVGSVMWHNGKAPG